MIGDPILEEKIRSTLNSSEEFAIGILNSNSQNHVAVSSIKKPFIQIVEEYAVPLYFYIGVMDDKFLYLSELYRHWKKEVGFIPRVKEDIIDRYKEREKIYKR